jgi:hypothetical protein
MNKIQHLQTPDIDLPLSTSIRDGGQYSANKCNGYELSRGEK